MRAVSGPASMKPSWRAYAIGSSRCGLPAPEGLLVAGDPLDASPLWVRPELVAEVRFVGWAGSGRLRHAVYLGLREDKPAADVVHDVAGPEAARWPYRAGRRGAAR